MLEVTAKPWLINFSTWPMVEVETDGRGELVISKVYVELVNCSFGNAQILLQETQGPSQAERVWSHSRSSVFARPALFKAAMAARSTGWY